MVGAVVAKYWNECDTSIESRADTDPGQNHLENREMNVPQEHCQAGKEEEQGKMYQCGQHFDYHQNVTLLDAFGKERTTFSPFVETGTCLSDLEVSSSPLLPQRREESTANTDR
jgi:hypothetical protein